MAEQTWGKITARGSATFVAQVREALDECVNITNPPLEERLPRQFVIEEHTRKEFKDKGFVFAGGGVNEGRVVKVLPITVLWVRSDISTKKPARAKHIDRHEIFHVFPMAIQQMAACMLLMEDEEGKHPTNWRGPYKMRPEECHADTCAEAASGKDSPWDDFDFYGLDVKDTDVPKILEITLRSAPAGGGVSPPPPVPLPPIDPRITELETQLETARTLAKQITNL